MAWARFRDDKGRFLPGNPFRFIKGLPFNEQPSIKRHFEKFVAKMDDFYDYIPEPVRRVWIPGLGLKTEWFGAHTIIKISELDRDLLIEDLRKIEHPDDEIQKALKEIGYYITDNVVPRIFKEEAVNPRSAWQQLASSTIRWRNSIDRPYSKGAEEGGMLRPYGGLFKEVKSHHMVSVEEEEGGYRMVISGQNIENEFRRKLFYWHQLGTDFPMPDRKMIPTKEEDLTWEERSDINEIFQNHMDNLMGFR